MAENNGSWPYGICHKDYPSSAKHFKWIQHCKSHCNVYRQIKKKYGVGNNTQIKSSHKNTLSDMDKIYKLIN